MRKNKREEEEGVRGAAGKQIKDTMRKDERSRKKDKGGWDTKTKNPGKRRWQTCTGFASQCYMQNNQDL